MKNIEIIGDEIFYNNVLVAKLVDSSQHTVQGEFIDEMKILNDRLDYYENEINEDA